MLDVGGNRVARRLDGVFVGGGGHGGGHGGSGGAVRGPGEGLDGGQRHGFVGLVALGHALAHAHTYAQQVGLYGGRLALLMLLLTVRYTSAGWRSGGRARTPLGVAIRAGIGKVVGREEGGDGWLARTLVPVCGAGEVLVCAEWHSCGERAGGR